MFGKQDVLVVGATGQQGGAVARTLLRKGHNVRALTRTAKSRSASYLSALGAEIIVGDLLDTTSLERALKGMNSVFMVTTPYELGTQSEIRQGKNLVDVIERSHISHTVFSSVASADQDTGIPHFESKHEIEEHLLDSGVSHTVIAPVFFMDNWLGPMFLPAIKEGNVAMAMSGNRMLQQIDVEDIGNFACLVLEHPDDFRGQRIDIASDELTGKEVARLIGRRVGHHMGYFNIPLETVRSQSKDFAMMFEWFDEIGYAVDTEALREDYPEVGWTYFDEWLNRHDWKTVLATEPLHIPEDRIENIEDLDDFEDEQYT